MKNKGTGLFLFVLVITVLVLTGCQPKPAALSDEQVGQVAADVLTAMNEGNYPDFTRDFSDQMKAAIPETGFIELRDLLQEASGNYLSCVQPTLLNTSGMAVYRFSCQFEKEQVFVTLTFKIGGEKVEGLFFDSTNLREAAGE